MASPPTACLVIRCIMFFACEAAKALNNGLWGFCMVSSLPAPDPVVVITCGDAKAWRCEVDERHATKRPPSVSECSLLSAGPGIPVDHPAQPVARPTSHADTAAHGVQATVAAADCHDGPVNLIAQQGRQVVHLILSPARLTEPNAPTLSLKKDTEPAIHSRQAASAHVAHLHQAPNAGRPTRNHRSPPRHGRLTCAGQHLEPKTLGPSIAIRGMVHGPCWCTVHALRYPLTSVS